MNIRVHIEAAPEMWTAARIDFATANRNNVVFRVIGRLKPGVSIEQAQLQADRLAADLRQHFPIKQTAGLYFHVVPMFFTRQALVVTAMLILRQPNTSIERHGLRKSLCRLSRRSHFLLGLTIPFL